MLARFSLSWDTEKPDATLAIKGPSIPVVSSLVNHLCLCPFDDSCYEVFLIMASNSVSIQELDKFDQSPRVEEKLITLLSEFVDTIASHANIDLGHTPKVCYNL